MEHGSSYSSTIYQSIEGFTEGFPTTDTRCGKCGSRDYPSLSRSQRTYHHSNSYRDYVEGNYNLQLSNDIKPSIPGTSHSSSIGDKELKNSRCVSKYDLMASNMVAPDCYGWETPPGVDYNIKIHKSKLDNCEWSFEGCSLYGGADDWGKDASICGSTEHPSDRSSLEERNEMMEGCKNVEISINEEKTSKMKEENKKCDVHVNGIQRVKQKFHGRSSFMVKAREVT